MKLRLTLLILLVLILFVLSIFLGSVHIPAAEVFRTLVANLPHGFSSPEQGEAEGVYSYIILGSRLPSALTAALAGAGLATSGLLLQTAFHNPLAGPSILGISSGANLGVAIVMLAFGGSITAGLYTWNGYLAVVAAAFLGSLLIMGLLLLFSSLLKNNLMLLITGIMMGYITSSAISLLNFLASVDNIQSFLIWGMGNFNSVSMQQMPIFASLTLLGLVLALLLIKPLNAILLGEQYAVNLGIDIRRTRNLLLLATGLLTAVITAYCGPVAFLGLATPHVAFLLLGTSNHRILLPTTMLTGAVLALLCNILCTLPPVTVIPLNAVTPILGAPVILYIILRRKQ
ncbi:MAG: iron ABC transporter permease [Bacteroidaceae bacterium]|nr:iron ABC transporter permease [Bacteroidaceae bacterium]